MSASRWTDRNERIARLVRAPLNFLRFQSYRAAVFRGLAFGEAVALGKVDPARFDEAANPDRPQSRIDFLWRRQFPAVNVIASGTGLLSAEGTAALALVGALARAGARPRLLVIDAAVTPLEGPLRRLLEDAHGLPRSAQACVEVADASSRMPMCGAADLFVAVGAGPLAVARASLAECGRETELRRVDPAVPDVGALLAELRARQADPQAPPDPAATLDRVSARGLRYRVLLDPPADLPGRRVCLFVHFDPDGRIDPHVRRYLEALKACGLDILLVSSGAVQAEDLAAVSPLLAGAIQRENIGLDFSGWALALELFPQLTACPAVVIANDSVYGPVGDLQAMVDRMTAEPWALWGATRNYDIAEHLQSWFVWFGPEALQSSAFGRFWSGVLPLSDKRAIIETYEVPLQGAFAAAGLAVGAAVDLMLLQVANGNPTMHPWRRLLDHGCPFVKVQLLRDDPVRSDLVGWTEELSARGYPVRLILDHLSRVARHAAALGQR